MQYSLFVRIIVTAVLHVKVWAFAQVKGTRVTLVAAFPSMASFAYGANSIEDLSIFANFEEFGSLFQKPLPNEVSTNKNCVVKLS